jgi:hypothetical protein
MPRYDREIEELRRSVHCAVVLERQSPPWRIDRKESSRQSLKYRRSKGEILIVSHQGRGWWDPQSDAKGDVFALVQHFDPSLNFGQVRKVLREFAGLPPALPAAIRRQKIVPVGASPAGRWAAQRPCHWGSRAWRYLTRERCLPPRILAVASAIDVLREGPKGSAWFAYRDEAGRVTHVEIRSPAYRGALRGGTKSLFRFRFGAGSISRLVLTEAPIDALSLAAIEALRKDTLYAATGGGMGPPTIAAITRIVAEIAATPGAIFCSATDADPPGDRYAAIHAAFAQAAATPFRRLRPPMEGADWNKLLQTKGEIP